MRPIEILLVCGTSESGKTTLIEALVPALGVLGVACATVKHHRGPVEVDRPGKDTWRHRRAGARATFFVTRDELTAFYDRPPDLTPADLLPLCPPGVQLLLVEGFKELSGHPRLEVVRSGRPREVSWSPEVLCVATDVPGLEAPCPVYGLDDAAGLARFVAERLL